MNAMASKSGGLLRDVVVTQRRPRCSSAIGGYLVALALLLAGQSFGGSAYAQDGSHAAAEALFEEGRELLEQGKHDEACPKLAESQRIDPATGTLLALALCHEAQGKLASAWAEFKAVEAQALQAGRHDREKLARERAVALRPRLSTLTLEVPPTVAKLEGLELRIDGARIGSARYGVAVPIDGGKHEVEAVAPGKEAWRTTLLVNAESHAARIAVPILQNVPRPERPPPAVNPSASADPNSEPSSLLRTASYITAGAGVVALGLGTYLALDAKRDHNSAQRDCDDAGCSERAYQAGEDARRQGNVATALFVLGGASTAVGAALWFLSSNDAASGDDRHATWVSGPRLERAVVGPRGLALEGSF